MSFGNECRLRVWYPLSAGATTAWGLYIISVKSNQTAIFILTYIYNTALPPNNKCLLQGVRNNNNDICSWIPHLHILSAKSLPWLNLISFTFCPLHLACGKRTQEMALSDGLEFDAFPLTVKRKVSDFKISTIRPRTAILASTCACWAACPRRESVHLQFLLIISRVIW